MGPGTLFRVLRRNALSRSKWGRNTHHQRGTDDRIDQGERASRPHVSDHILTTIQFTIVGEATYLLTIMMLKISLAIFFARIVIKPWQLFTIYITVGVNILSSLSSFFYVLLRCGPNLNIYVYKQLAYECTPDPLDRFFAYQQAAFTTLTDLTFATLPIFILWNAHMCIRSKISVGFILSLAAL